MAQTGDGTHGQHGGWLGHVFHPRFGISDLGPARAPIITDLSIYLIFIQYFKLRIDIIYVPNHKYFLHPKTVNTLFNSILRA